MFKCFKCKTWEYSNPNALLMSYHRFPANENLRKKWLKALNLDENIKVPKNARICSDHFDPLDFVVTLSGRKCLKKGCIPKSTCGTEESVGSGENVTSPVEEATTPVEPLELSVARESEDSRTAIPPETRAGVVATPSEFSSNEGTSNESGDNGAEGQSTFSPPKKCMKVDLKLSQPSSLREFLDTIKRSMSTGQISGVESLRSVSSIDTAPETEALLLQLQPGTSESFATSEFKGFLPLRFNAQKRKRRYVGDITSDDFATPRKAKKNYRILKDTMAHQKNTIKVLQNIVARLRKKITDMKTLISSSNNESTDTSSSASDSSSGFSSDSSMENYYVFKKRRKLHCIDNYVTGVVVNFYDDLEFKEHFRLSRTTYNYLTGKIRADNVLPIHCDGRPKMSPEKALLLTLWYLSNMETFRQIADRFDVSKSSAHQSLSRIIDYFSKHANRYISWPGETRQREIRQGFQQKRGIQGVVGAIDGCHININRPVEDSHVYCNRKSDHSILLQAVCDHEKRFIDFFCGEAGSIHDARLLKRSNIYTKGQNGFLHNNFLLGDSAYPCLNWLIPPFRDNGHLSENQKIFNFRHSSSRIVIENAFGLLKGRFRRLDHFENTDLTFIVRCVITAGVLHNICIGFNDETEIDEQINTSYDDNDENMLHSISGITPQYARRLEIFNEMFRS